MLLATASNSMSLENTSLPSSRLELHFRTTITYIVTTIATIIATIIITPTMTPKAIPILPTNTENNKQNE